MKPAPSVIIFTSLSGIGFGLLAFLGFGLPAVDGLVAFVFFAVAYALSVGGLLASTFHLGHPERAIKAFSQWRTSWLSREAWLSVVALVVMGIYAIGVIFFQNRSPILGALGALLCMATVFSTAMIYAQLKSVPRWNTAWTPIQFLGYCISGGALFAGQTKIAMIVLPVLAVIQVVVWVHGDGALKRSGSTLATATGLKGDRIRAFEPPHTGTNYLLQEFGYKVARKHATKLRMITLIAAVGTPILAFALPFNHWLAAVAALSHVIGVFASRWLFFAQAEHVSMFYYGR
jgi:DMSO reductase anchor subunit